MSTSGITFPIFAIFTEPCYILLHGQAETITIHRFPVAGTLYQRKPLGYPFRRRHEAPFHRSLGGEGRKERLGKG